ncbi:MAG: 30S ribosomal protein S16 [Erysipelotrichaceae bacterium]|nr:30S ribosomal protein S16 [Erysipelotrichaceae bacterium]
MVKIRLKRMGAKKSPFYRVVVSDSRDRRDGREIEVVGNYDPKTNPATVNIDEEKVIKWLNNGALPTDTVRSILSSQGIMKKYADGKKAAR